MAEKPAAGEPGAGERATGPDVIGRTSRRAALAALGTAAAALLAACGPTVVAGAVGGPFATIAPSPTAASVRATPSTTTPTPTHTPTPTPTPTPTVPPLAEDSISLNGFPLSFKSPGLVPGWVKRLGVATSSANRTFYDDAQTKLHITVEVDLPLGLTPFEHAEELNVDKQTTEEGYHLLALQSGPLGGATWAFTSVSSGAPQYVIDWFYSYPTFDAAILVLGPAAAKPLIKAIWLEIVNSASVPIPYSSDTAVPASSSATTDTDTGTGTTATIAPGSVNGGG